MTYSKTGDPRPPDAQSVGSVITYLRRYSLAAIAQIAQEDDDANAASHHPDQTTQRNRGGLSRELKCPECGSELWDNRHDKETGKRSSKFPDLKCSSTDCGWTQWLDSWAENLLAEAEAARQAEAITDKQHDKIRELVGNKDVPKMVKAQKKLTELARYA